MTLEPKRLKAPAFVQMRVGDKIQTNPIQLTGLRNEVPFPTVPVW